MNLALARAMGASGLGTYQVFVAWTKLSASTSNLGFPPYNLRHVSAMKAQGEHAEAHSITVQSVRRAAMAGAGVAILGLLAPQGIVEALAGNAETALGVRWALVAGALFSLQRILAATLNALGRSSTAITLEFSALPLALLLVGVSFLWWGNPLPRAIAIGTHIVLLATIVAALALLWWRETGREADRNGSTHRFDLRSLRDLWGLNVVTMGFTSLPMILVPHFALDAAEVGHFGVAQRLVGLSAMLLTALAAVMSPDFARRYDTSDGHGLRRDLLWSILGAVVLYLPLLGAYIGFPERILGLFGASFSDGATLLVVLAFGQLANAATGLSGQLLTMTGRESSALAVTLLALGILVGGAYALGGSHGAVGVAIATAGAVAFRNLALLVLAFRATTAVTRDASRRTPP